MPALFGVIPLAGLALGVIGQLAKRRKGRQQQDQSNAALSSATSKAAGTKARDEATERASTRNAETPAQQTARESQGMQENSGDEASKKPGKLVRPGEAGEDDPGLAARLGRESLERARKKNQADDAAAKRKNL